MSTSGWRDEENMVYVGGCVGVGVCVCGGILFSHEKEESHAICENMGELWGHYAKQNKADRQIQITYDVTYTWTLEKKNWIHGNWEQTGGCQGGGGGRNGWR